MTNIVTTDPKGNLAEQALAFLQMFHPDRPWCICYNDPKKGFQGKTFRSAEDLRSFFTYHIGRSEIWFHVNEVRNGLPDGVDGKKATKAGISFVHYLYVDIDAKNGVTKADIEARITPEAIAELDVPQPTYIVDSGHGFHLYWKMETPFPINSVDEAEEVGKYNIWLAQKFGGDSCHDVCRILRVPFTVNVKDDPVPVRLLLSEPGRVYAWESFQKASKPNKRQHVSLGDLTPVEVPTDGTFFEKYEMPPKLKDVIGSDRATLETQYKSRSEVVFYIANEFKRKLVPAGEAIGWFLAFDNLDCNAHIHFDKNGVRRSRREAESKARQTVANAYSTVDEVKNTRWKAIIETGRLSDTVDKTAQALVEHATGIFQRGDSLVRVARPSELRERAPAGSRETLRDPKALVLKNVDVPQLTYMTDKAGIGFARDYDPKTRTFKSVGSAPHSIMSTLIGTLDQHEFPYLHAISHTPTLTRTEPGYDPEEQVLLAYSKDRFKGLSERPDVEQARAALDVLKAPVAHYQWADDYSLSVYLAAVLASVIRATMETCPMFAFNAYNRGAGKTQLAQCVALIGSGYRAPVKSWLSDKTENEKMLKSSLKAGDAALILDNTKVPIGGAIIEAVLTESRYAFRGFGTLEDVTVSTRTLMMATGNNIVFDGDMGRRALTATVVPRGERPELEVFPFNPVQKVAAERDLHVIAALTILRWYHQKTDRKPVPTFHSFADFDLIRGALIELGEQDPVQGLSRTRESTSEHEGLYYLLKAIELEYGDRPFTSVDVIERSVCGMNEMVASATLKALDMGDRPVTRKRVTWALKQAANKPLNGRVLRSETKAEGNVVFSLCNPAT